jgi:hypothetical protein
MSHQFVADPCQADEFGWCVWDRGSGRFARNKTPLGIGIPIRNAAVSLTRDVRIIKLVSGITINICKSGKIIVQVTFDENTRHDASALWNEVLPVDTTWQIAACGAMI